MKKESPFEYCTVYRPVEFWKPVVGYENYYMVSDLGHVKSLYNNTRISNDNKILKQKDDGKGYKRVNIYKPDAKPKAELVSRMVARAFIENPNNLPMVGHNDDNKYNNTVENLYWTNATENNHHNGKYERFLQKHNEKINIIAEKLAKPLIVINKNTGEKIEYSSVNEASKALNINRNNIGRYCNKIRKPSKGEYEFLWK